MTIVCIGVGSNSEAETNLPKGIALLRDEVNITAVSPVYESASVNEGDTQPYLNAALTIETDMQPPQIKLLLVEIENACGRVRVDAEGNKSKVVTLDFDLLLYGDEVTVYMFNQKTYRLPHEDIVKYAHVAVPLAHVAPDTLHPDTQQSMLTIAIDFTESQLVLRKDIELNV